MLCADEVPGVARGPGLDSAAPWTPEPLLRFDLAGVEHRQLTSIPSGNDHTSCTVRLPDLALEQYPALSARLPAACSPTGCPRTTACPGRRACRWPRRLHVPHHGQDAEDARTTLQALTAQGGLGRSDAR
ncbi:hypothetical protein GCM10010206_61210 [Streptomyces cinerochromogenes]|nr:hypothetical protein GCM10010206_61210 [Streptomyces cinerochromogenes]